MKTRNKARKKMSYGIRMFDIQTYFALCDPDGEIVLVAPDHEGFPWRGIKVFDLAAQGGLENICRERFARVLAGDSVSFVATLRAADGEVYSFRNHWAPTNLADTPVGIHATQMHRRWHLLTDRQQQIISEFKLRDTCRAVANAIGVAEKTVHSHRANICKKIGLDGAAEFYLFCLVNG